MDARPARFLVPLVIVLAAVAAHVARPRRRRAPRRRPRRGARRRPSPATSPRGSRRTAPRSTASAGLAGDAPSPRRRAHRRGPRPRDRRRRLCAAHAVRPARPAPRRRAPARSDATGRPAASAPLALDGRPAFLLVLAAGDAASAYACLRPAGLLDRLAPAEGGRLELYDPGPAGEPRAPPDRAAPPRRRRRREREALRPAAAPHGSQHVHVRRHGPPLGALLRARPQPRRRRPGAAQLAAARSPASLLALLAAWLLGAVAPHGAARGRAGGADDREPAREPDRPRPLERRARALRLRRLARPARAAAHDHRLPRPARRAATATGSTTTAASSSTSPSPARSGWTR